MSRDNEQQSAPEQAPSTPQITEFPSGLRHLLYFCDKRPPHLIQFALEERLMILFSAAVNNGRLFLRARAYVNGAQYSFQLVFVAALTSDNLYSLQTDVSWGNESTHQDYFRKTSKSWIQFWTRDFQPTSPPSTSYTPDERYQQHVAATLNTQGHLASIKEIHEAIVGGMKQGGTFSNAHKEGGTNIFWRNGKFIRSDYGDYTETKQFTDEVEFLKFLRQYCDFEITQHNRKEDLSELDAWKLILRKMSPVAPPHPDDLRGANNRANLGLHQASPGIYSTTGTTTLAQVYSTPLAKGLAIGLILLVAIGLAAWQFVSVKSAGLPLGSALRTPTHVVQIIQTTERYLPRLHRTPSTDRFRLELLAISLADPTKQETFKLIQQQQQNGAQPVTRILGADGDVVWIQALQTFAVNVKAKRVFREADLRKLNPNLNVFLNTAHAEFTDRFVAVSPDWEQAYSFSAETLTATPCPPPPRSGWLDKRLNDSLDGSFCQGGLVATNEWFGVLTEEEANRDFKPGYSLPREFPSPSNERLRQIYRGRLNINLPRPQIQDLQRVTSAEFYGARFVRATSGGDILRLANPTSNLLLHRSGTNYLSALRLSRLKPDGDLVWSSDIGVCTVRQVLPGADSMALIGDQVAGPGKVPEPTLVLIAADSGSIKSVSLKRH